MWVLSHRGNFYQEVAVAMPSRSSGANMRGVFLFEESRDNWVYPQQCTHGIYCVLKGFLGIITHKYPLYRAYIGIFMDFP